ncbi:unnamed protein product [Dracunculus medinensis]|uniref:Secreted protein n=1 Tax=Dracunculus medinensis TaxID=318479 RepID=A0A0N4UQ26_DRAME|nr:unnamed protein product [Dracunculus medinensis]
MYASWVNGTNLLLVVIVQSRTSSSVCYDKNQCPMISPPELQFAFTQVCFKIQLSFLPFNFRSF